MLCKSASTLLHANDLKGESAALTAPICFALASGLSWCTDYVHTVGIKTDDVPDQCCHVRLVMSFRARVCAEVIWTRSSFNRLLPIYLLAQSRGFARRRVQPPGGDILASRLESSHVVHHVLMEMNPVLIQQFLIQIFYSVHIILHTFLPVNFGLINVIS